MLTTGTVMKPSDREAVKMISALKGKLYSYPRI